MKIVITGGRLFDDKEMMFHVLDKIHKKTPIEKIAHGDCTGADMLAREWGLDRGLTVVAYPAVWTSGGDAGEKRNEYMFTDFQPDYILAFPGGTGTKNSIKFAKRKGYNIVYAQKLNQKRSKSKFNNVVALGS
jgi:hypothetical protein